MSSASVGPQRDGGGIGMYQPVAAVAAVAWLAVAAVHDVAVMESTMTTMMSLWSIERSGYVAVFY